MSFNYLLLGHLLGDFVFQTNVIADKKAEHTSWISLHAFIVTICMFLTSIPFGIEVMVLILVNGILHFLIDYSKPRITARFAIPGLVYFLLDQIVHIMIIYIISIRVNYEGGFLPISQEYVKALSVVVFVTSFAAVLNQFILTMLFPNANKQFFEKGEKPLGITARLIITLSLYFSYAVTMSYLLLVVVISIIYLYQYRTQWNSWMSSRHLYMKLLLDFSISLMGLIFLMQPI